MEQEDKKGILFKGKRFFEYAHKTNELELEYKQMAEDFSQSIKGESGRDRAMGLALGQGNAFKEKYSGRLTEKSHGESFLDFFKARIHGQGLYILDEPEVPLSPMRQLSLLYLISEMAQEQSQFIIATHSPLLMALPGATIYQLTEEGDFLESSYEDLEHVQFYRRFLQSPERYLK